MCLAMSSQNTQRRPLPTEVPPNGGAPRPTYVSSRGTPNAVVCKVAGIGATQPAGQRSQTMSHESDFRILIRAHASRSKLPEYSRK